MNSITNSQAFSVLNNVTLEVRGKDNIITKTVKCHNKASRSMVTGILRFLCGHFTTTTVQDDIQYDNAKNYIPCFFNFGDGGVILEENEQGQITQKHNSENSRIPELEETWNELVDYNSTSLKREFFTGKTEDSIVSNSRFKIRLVKTTLQNESTADMDSIYFYCEASPGELNSYYYDNPIFLSEIGLFASSTPGTTDLLASIKLSNYLDTDNELQTNVLYVRPEDTVIVKWIITVAAIGKDSVLKANVMDNSGNIITRDVRMIPSLGTVTVNNL